MKGFGVISNSIILIYHGREAFKSCYHPLYVIPISATTELVDTNDDILLQGYIEKKGKWNIWSERWCTLQKDGYLRYINHSNNIKQIDFQDSVFELQNNYNMLSI